MLNSVSNPTRNFLFLLALSALPILLISTRHIYPTYLQSRAAPTKVRVSFEQDHGLSEEDQRYLFEKITETKLAPPKTHFDDDRFVEKLVNMGGEAERKLAADQPGVGGAKQGEVAQNSQAILNRLPVQNPPQQNPDVSPQEIKTQDSASLLHEALKVSSETQGSETEAKANGPPMQQSNENLSNEAPTLLFPNKSPNELLGCVQSLLRPHIEEIESIRKLLLSNRHDWIPYNTDNNTRFVTYSENITHFQDIAKYKQIKTLFFREAPERAMNCMINGGRLHYDFGINNCSAVLDHAKRHVMFGENLYDMRCVHGQSETLTSEPIKDAAYQVGLPEKYKQDAAKKTLTYLQIIQDATVTVFGDVTTGSVDIIPQRCFPNRRIYLPDDPNELPLYDEVFSMSQFYGKGMFHANIEDISRMAPYISFLQQHPEIKIHIFDLDNPPVYLSMIKLDPSRFINDTVRAKILYMPGGVNCCLPTMFQTQIESFYLRLNLPNLGGIQRDTIVVVKRRHRRNRFFNNHQQITNMLRAKAIPLGLRVWEFSDSPLPTLSETAQMFNRAFMVVAPHGAGESNLIFTQPGTILLEGLCMDRFDGLVNVVFRTLSHILGGYYYGYYKPDAHCTETTAEDLAPYVDFYLKRLGSFR